VKNFLAILISAACITVFTVSGNAGPLSLSGTEDSGALAVDTGDEPFASVLSTTTDGSMEALSDSGFAPFIPIQLDQFVISLMDVSGEEATPEKNEFSSLSNFKLNTGVRTESYLADPQSLVMSELFGISSDPLKISSSIVFVGVGFNLNALYLQGNAYVGRPLDTLSNKMLPPQDPEHAKNQGVDTDAYGFEASAGYQLNNMIAVGASIGKMTDKNRETDETEEIHAVYAQAILAVAPGVQVKPGVGKVDRITEKEETDADEKDEDYYAGAIWEINF
jgi:hypothetical protein